MSQCVDIWFSRSTEKCCFNFFTKTICVKYFLKFSVYYVYVKLSLWIVKPYTFRNKERPHTPLRDIVINLLLFYYNPYVCIIPYSLELKIREKTRFNETLNLSKNWIDSDNSLRFGPLVQRESVV